MFQSFTNWLASFFSTAAGWLSSAAGTLSLVLVSVLAFAGSAQAQLVIPPDLDPEGIANDALTIVAPLVVVVVTVSLTLWAAMVVIRLIRRRSQQIQ